MLKVCGLKYPENIKALVTVHADFFGLIFYEKSPRFVADHLAESILEVIPKHIKKTGVFVNANPTVIQQKLTLFQLDALQFHGSETPEEIALFKAPNRILIKAFGVDEDFDFETTAPYAGVCDYFLFDTKTKNHGGSGKRFAPELLEKYTGETPFFISGGIDESILNEPHLLRHPKLAAIDVNSRFELEPGLKDTKRIETFATQLNLIFNNEQQENSI